MPFISGLGTVAAQLIDVGLSELEAPLSDRFIGDLDSAIEHHLLNISKAKRKGVIQPDAIGDDLAGEMM